MSSFSPFVMYGCRLRALAVAGMVACGVCVLAQEGPSPEQLMARIPFLQEVTLLQLPTAFCYGVEPRKFNQAAPDGVAVKGPGAEDPGVRVKVLLVEALDFLPVGPSPDDRVVITTEETLPDGRTLHPVYIDTLTNDGIFSFLFLNNKFSNHPNVRKQTALVRALVEDILDYEQGLPSGFLFPTSATKPLR